MTTDNLKSLARLASMGDVEAQSALCQTYEKEVRIVAKVHLGSRLRAHLDSLDITQSVHKSVIAGLIAGKFFIDSSRGLIALACMIARRKIAKQWRKHQRQVPVEPTSATNLQEWAEQLTQADASAEIDLILDGQLPVDVARERLRAIRESVTPIERLLIDRKLAGKSSAQIADELKLDPVAVRVRWSRLTAKIRQRCPYA